MSGSINGGLLAAYGGMAADPRNASQIEALRMFPYKFITSQPTAIGMATAPAAEQSQGGAAPGYDVGGAVGGQDNVTTPPVIDVATLQQLIDAGLIAPGTLPSALGGGSGAGPAISTGAGGDAMGGLAGAGLPGMAGNSRGGGLAGAIAGGGQIGGQGVTNGTGSSQSNLTTSTTSAPGGFMGGHPGATVGGFLGGTAGGLLGSPLGPLGSAALGFAGKSLGGWLGGLLDPPATTTIDDPALAQAKTDFMAPGSGSYAGAAPGTAPVGAVEQQDLAAPAGLAGAGPAASSTDQGAAASSGGPDLASNNSGMGVDQTGSGDPSNNDGQGNSYAIGGVIRPSSTRGFLRDLAHGSGLVKGISGGRSDAIHTSVPRGSYVMPADVVSGLGQGNTMAGSRLLSGALGKAGKAMGLKAGGRVEPVKVRLSAGEYVVHPKHAAALGNGSLAQGHALLDHVVAATRRRVAEQALTAQPPR